MSTSYVRQDYHKCHWKPKELVMTVGKSVFVVGFLAYFFYRSIWAVLPLSIIGIFFFRLECRRQTDRVRGELTGQFKECILSVAASLKAGYAVENAFVESRNDMRLLYGENSIIYQELELIRRGLVINIALEELLADLAARSGSDDIVQFAQVFAIAKKSGGKLPEIIQSTAERTGRRIDARMEIHTLLSGRQMEQNIMELMPFGILLYVGSSYKGYFDSFYHNLQGIVIMTVCLVVYIAAYLLGNKILQQIVQSME